MTDIAEHTEHETPGPEVTIRHPSGWRKTAAGAWLPPEDDAGSTDLTMALSIAVGAIVVGSFLPWAHAALGNVRGTDGSGNLTLLFGGIAGALLVRWHRDREAHRGLMTASLVLCVAAAAVAIHDFARVLHTPTQPQSGLFVAMTGALMATVIAGVLRFTPIGLEVVEGPTRAVRGT